MVKAAQERRNASTRTAMQHYNRSALRVAAFLEIDFVTVPPHPGDHGCKALRQDREAVESWIGAFGFA